MIGKCRIKEPNVISGLRIMKEKYYVSAEGVNLLTVTTHPELPLEHIVTGNIQRMAAKEDVELSFDEANYILWNTHWDTLAMESPLGTGKMIEITDEEELESLLAEMDEYNWGMFLQENAKIEEYWNWEDSICQEKEEECLKNMQNLLCKRAIRRLNREIDPSFLYCGDDFPNRFNTFDVLSVRIQRMDMCEINPLIDDYILGILEDEAEKAHCQSEGLYHCFRRMLDEHYYLKKIQDFVDRM